MLFLDYYRYKTAQLAYQDTIQNKEIKQCLETLKQESLTRFLAETSRCHPIDKLNGRTEAFLEEMTEILQEKYQV